MLRKCIVAAALFFGVLAPSVRAQNCAPFTDVLASSGFCGNIQWIYNRGITLGCTTNQFCPAQFVRRDQMAAFLYRLGFENAFLHGGNAFGETAVLGTTDNQAVDVRVNSARAMRYEPHPESPNVIGGSAANIVDVGVQGATIGGGGRAGNINQVAGQYGTVSGGIENRAGAAYATVAGGRLNRAESLASAVAGGEVNAATGTYSFVAGGASNLASGVVSFAAGQYARATGDFCVVFSLWGAPPGMPCGGSQFNIGAPHGLSVDYHAQRMDGGGTRFVYIGNNFAPFTITTWNGATLGDNGVWNSVSDVAKKEAFAEVDKRAILEKLAALPIRSFRYRVETDDVRHIGPTGQDFRAAFGLGHDEKTIGSVDADGVALAAIQGLNAKVEEQRTEIEAQRREIAELKQAVGELLRAVKDGDRIAARAP